MEHRKRIKKLLQALHDHTTAPAAAVVSANPSVEKYYSDHDDLTPENSDLWYFTGITSPEVSLVLNPALDVPVVLLAPIPSPRQLVWNGAPKESLEAAAKRLQIPLLRSNSLLAEAEKRLRGVRTLLYQNAPGELSHSVARRIFETPYGTRMGQGVTVLSFLETVTAPLRLIKSPAEIKAITAAAQVTAKGLAAVRPLLRAGNNEREIAAVLTATYHAAGASHGFSPIVARGVNAATLHYRNNDATLRRGELVLIDTGAKFAGYCADISRTYSLADEEPSKMQRYALAAVRTAQKAAIAEIKPGRKILLAHRAAQRELWEFLRREGIERRPFAVACKEDGALKTFFPHGIGHQLGIDVHDQVAPLYGAERTFVEGMVFTVEPGLYFRKPVRSIPALGIRIEDDVVVTEKGCRVLTSTIE